MVSAVRLMSSIPDLALDGYSGGRNVQGWKAASHGPTHHTDRESVTTFATTSVIRDGEDSEWDSTEIRVPAYLGRNEEWEKGLCTARAMRRDGKDDKYQCVTVLGERVDQV